MKRAAQGHSASRAGVLHPLAFTIGGDEPVRTTMPEHNDRSRTRSTGLAAAYGQKMEPLGSDARSHSDPDGDIQKLAHESKPIAPAFSAHSNSRIPASACSSQNRMSISRYIVVAVVRCRRAWSGLPIRQ